MAVNEFGDEIVEGPVNEFGDPIESAVAIAEPTQEPLPPEQAFDLAGKQWDAAIENDVSLQVAQQWFYDAAIAATDPDSFAEPVPDNRTGFSENFKREWTPVGAITKIPITGGIVGAIENQKTIMAANRLLDEEFDYDRLNRYQDRVAELRPGLASGLAPPSALSIEFDRAVIAQAIKDAEFQQRGKTFGGKVAVGVSQLPTWMVEFMATGGLATLGDDVAQKAGQKLLGKYVNTLAGKATIKTSKLALGAVVRTSTGLLPRVGEKATERQRLISIGVAGEEAWATSLAKAWGTVAIESFSEETGKLFSLSVLKQLPFGGKFFAGLEKEWTALTGGTAENFATKMLTKGGYSTIIGELGEERIGTLLREATGVSDRRGNPFQRMWEGMKEDFEPENLGAEIVTLLAPASVRRGFTMGASLTPGVTVPAEAEQLEAAVGVGPLQFDTPQDAQGYADKVKQVADREDKEVTVTVDENTVSVEEVVEAEGAVSVTDRLAQLQADADALKETRIDAMVEGGLTEEKAEEVFDKMRELENQQVLTQEKVTEPPPEAAVEPVVAEPAPEGAVIPEAPEAVGRVEVLEGVEIIVREKQQEVGVEGLSAVSKPNSVYRGMTEAEFNDTIGEGDGVISQGDFRFASEGTNFANDFADAESFIDFGRDDPRKTGKPTFIVEVGKSDNLVQNRQGDFEAESEIPSSQIQRIWKIEDIGGRLVAKPVDIQPTIPVAEEIPERKRIISQEKFDAALKRFTDSSKLRTGLDPQQLKDAAIIGGFLVESGVRKFGDWSKRMISELGDSVKPHLQDIWNGLKAEKPKAEPKKKPVPKKKPAKKKPKKPEFPKGQSVSKPTQVILGADPLDQILGALDKAKVVQPVTEAAKRKELSRRVGAAAGALKSNVKKGTPTEESIFKSTGLLKGPLTDYEQVYDSIEDTLTAEEKEAAYAKINTHPGLKYFEVLNIATSFRKLLQGAALTPGDVTNIEKVFGKTFADITDIRQDVSGLYEKLITLWKAGLLTGLKTSGLNTLSNAAHAMSESASDIPAALVDRVFQLFTGERALVFTTKGYRAGVIKGLENGWEYLRTGYSERDIGRKLDYNAVSFGNSKFAKALQAYEEFIFHLLGAEDQPFYYGAKAKSLFSQAIAQAINKKLKGAERDAFVENLVENPTDDMLRHAVHDAEIAVFQNQTGLGDAAKLFQKINISGVPVGQIIVPFGRTPAAVATQIINYTPLGVVGEISAQIRKGEFNQRAISRATGRAVIGTGTLFIGGALLKAGLMTLDRPRDERERKLWELEGRSANSIKIGGKWRTVQTLGPAGGVLLIGGHFAHQLEQEGSPTKAIAKALAGSAKSFSEQTFVRGVNQAVSALVDPELSAEFWFSSMAGSLVPTIVADIARAKDEIGRRTDGPVQRLQSRIPVLREKLPPRIDVFGQDLPRYGGNVLEVMADPTRPSKIRNDVVVDELRRLADNDIKVTPTLLGDRSGFDILTVEENSALWRRSGELTYKVLLAWIDSEGYKNIGNDFSKGQTIEALTRKTKAAAKAEMVSIKLSQGVSLIKLAESGLLSIEGLDALQFFTK